MAVQRRYAIAVSLYAAGPSVEPSGTVDRVAAGYGYVFEGAPTPVGAVITILTGAPVTRVISTNAIIRRDL